MIPNDLTEVAALRAMNSNLEREIGAREKTIAALKANITEAHARSDQWRDKALALAEQADQAEIVAAQALRTSLVCLFVAVATVVAATAVLVL